MMASGKSPESPEIKPAPAPPPASAPAVAGSQPADGNGVPAAVNTSPGPPRSPARRVAVLVLALFVLLLAWQTASDRLAPYSPRGAVTGYVAQLTPRVVGQVTEVFVQDGDIVEAGTRLAQLDPRAFDLAVQQAEVALARALQSTRASATGIVSAQAGVTRARTQLVNVQAATSRTLELVERGFVSRVQADDAKSALQAAQAQLSQAEAELARAMIAAGGGGAANPEVRAAQLQLEQAQLDRHFTTLTAPTRGVVTNLRLAIGQYVAPGSPAMTFIDGRGGWITVDLRENQLGNVRPGDDAHILFDAMPGSVYRGRVQSIAWGVDVGRSTAGGLLQNLPESQWFEPARRIPIHIELDGGLDNWPHAARVGGKVAVVVFAQGRDNPVAWVASGLLRLRSWLSYLY